MHVNMLTAEQAEAIADYARLLLSTGLLTHRQYVLLDAMLWELREPGQAMVVANLKTLAETAALSRSTAAESLRRLEELGVLRPTASGYLLVPMPADAEGSEQNS